MKQLQLWVKIYKKYMLLNYTCIFLFLLLFLFNCGGGGSEGTVGTLDNDNETIDNETIDIDSSAYLQYRNSPDLSKRRYTSWMEVSEAEAPLSVDELQFQMIDSSGSIVSSNSSIFYPQTDVLFYDCSNTPCSTAENRSIGGFSAHYNNVTADNYRFVLQVVDVSPNIGASEDDCIKVLVDKTQQFDLLPDDFNKSSTPPKADNIFFATELTIDKIKCGFIFAKSISNNFALIDNNSNRYPLFDFKISGLQVEDLTDFSSSKAYAEGSVLKLAYEVPTQTVTSSIEFVYDYGSTWADYESSSQATIDINLSDGNDQIDEVSSEIIAEKDVNFPGKLILPFVESESMESEYSNGDLVLSWSNPVAADNWKKVDELRIVLTTTDGIAALYVRADTTSETVTIPESLISQATTLGYGDLAYWEIQTRAYDDNGMNFARGYSNVIEIASTQSFTINDAYLQYRNYGNPSNDRYATWIGITKDGEPIQSTEVVGFKVKNSTGSTISPTSSEFYRSSPYYFYSCITLPCTEQSDIIDSGYWANFDDLTAGNYQIEVETNDGQTLTENITYQGKLILPGVDVATMESEYINGDLVLDWTNPKNENNWDEVDQIRIVMIASDGAEVLYIRANSNTETITIPESLIEKIDNLGHGSITTWEIQTRAYDANGMNFARGYLQY